MQGVDGGREQVRQLLARDAKDQAERYDPRGSLPEDGMTHGVHYRRALLDDSATIALIVIMGEVGSVALLIFGPAFFLSGIHDDSTLGWVWILWISLCVLDLRWRPSSRC